MLNINKARIMGGELAWQLRYNNFFRPQNVLRINSTFVYTQGDDLTGNSGWFKNGNPLRYIPPFNTKHDIKLQNTLSASFSWYVGGDVKYYTGQHRYALSSEGGYFMPAYCLFGASAGFSYKGSAKKWELKLKADNLTDNKYYAFESIVYSMGRNFKIMLILSYL